MFTLPRTVYVVPNPAAVAAKPVILQDAAEQLRAMANYPKATTPISKGFRPTF